MVWKRPISFLSFHRNLNWSTPISTAKKENLGSDGKTSICNVNASEVLIYENSKQISKVYISRYVEKWNNF